MAQEATEKKSLKETNPVKYYKRKRKWLGVGKGLCALVPALTILIVYAIQSLMGARNTNPFNPWRFSVGIALIVVAVVVITVAELKAITKTSKEAGTGPKFTSAIVWMIVGTILWLLYLTMFYLIIFCFAEFVGSVISAILTYAIEETYVAQDKEDTAERNAKALARVNANEDKGKKVEIE